MINKKELIGTDLKDIFRMVVDINREYDKVYHDGMDMTKMLRDDLHHVVDEMFEFVEAVTEDNIVQMPDTSIHMDEEAVDIPIMAMGFFLHYITWKYHQFVKAGKLETVDDDAVVKSAYNVFVEKFHEVYNRDWERKKNGVMR